MELFAHFWKSSVPQPIFGKTCSTPALFLEKIVVPQPFFGEACSTQCAKADFRRIDQDFHQNVNILKIFVEFL